MTPVALARESAAIEVNGAAVEKGGSYEAALQPGKNIFTIVVKADGGAATYELVVDRGGAPPARW
ncbi:MAG: cadherin-like beta sandwich domain-containing protein [Vicinamibacteria bacterium]